MSDNYTRDPDDLWGDTVTHVIEIKVRRNGSMSVAGSINNKAYALAMLEQAKDAVRNHHARGTNLIGIPPRELELPA